MRNTATRVSYRPLAGASGLAFLIYRRHASRGTVGAIPLVMPASAMRGLVSLQHILGDASAVTHLVAVRLAPLTDLGNLFLAARRLLLVATEATSSPGDRDGLLRF